MVDKHMIAVSCGLHLHELFMYKNDVVGTLGTPIVPS